MLKNILLSTIGLLSVNTVQGQLPFQKPVGTYNITSEISVDFVLSYEGITPFTTENDIQPLKFSNAFEPEYVIDTYSNVSNCRFQCAYDNNCLGLVEYRTNETVTLCNTLSNLGVPTETESYSYSYKKISLHRYRHDNHSVYGQVINVDGVPQFRDYQFKIYIDTNHNGEYDAGEPYNYTYNGDDFEFNNLHPGVYFFKLEIPDGCLQYIPSIFGTGQYYYGTGYADIVLEYYKDGHHSLRNIPGGIVGDNSNNVDVSIDFILNNNRSTYLSFFNNYSITLGLIDETIHDTPGDDIFFVTYNSYESDIQAHVSVSTYNEEYHYLGILNSTQVSFDLADINYTIPIDHIHLHFFGNDTNGPMNIISVRGQINTSYYPAYANQWEIPTEDNMLFLIDCSYVLRCSTFCGFHLFHDYEYYSCLNACQRFDNSNQCYCDDQENNFYELTVEEYDVESCERGCEYALNSYVFPDYRAVMNAEGFGEDIITTLECDNCLDLLIDTCEAIRECRGFDFNDNSIHHIFRKYNYVFDNSSYFILKNNGTETNDIGYMTTTTSLTTSPTSTQTSSHTSSQTSSPTTTQSISGTTTGTSTQTSTYTTTTSPTTSITSTPTSTLTSTVTTTILVVSETSSTALTGTEISLIVICILFAIVCVAFMFISRRKKQQQNISGDNRGPNNFNPSFDDNTVNPDLIYTEDSNYRDIAPFYTDSPVDSPKELPVNRFAYDSANGYMDVSRHSRSSLNSSRGSGSPRSPSRVTMSTL